MYLSRAILKLQWQSLMQIIFHIQKEWLETVRREWFGLMALKPLVPQNVQCYISTLSRLSHRLLEIVVNLKDEKV